MWNGYFALGGREIGNSARSLVYQRESDCAIYWIDDEPCDGFLQAVDADYSSIEEAPWYDEDDPEVTSGFLGVYVISMEGLSDSTRSARIVQRAGAGARIGTVRRASKRVRVKVLLTATSMASLEAGREWMDAMLDGSGCGVHLTACETADFAFFDDCPPVRGDGETDEEYAYRVDERRRFLHGVKCVSGPFVVEELPSNTGRHVGYIMEFSIEAEEPLVYSVSRQVDLPPTVPTVIEDAPYNQVRFPSAGLEGLEVVVATNYSQNPSLEVNATNWAAAVQTETGSNPAPYFTSGRVTGELAGSGVAAMRARILGNGSTSASGIASPRITHTVSLSGIPAGARPSLSIWVAGASVGGATGAALQSVSIYAEFLNGSSVVVGGAVPLGASTSPPEIAGKAWSNKSVPIPATAVSVRFTAILFASWSSSATPASNSDIRLYADAAAVTVP